MGRSQRSCINYANYITLSYLGRSVGLGVGQSQLDFDSAISLSLSGFVLILK